MRREAWATLVCRVTRVCFLALHVHCGVLTNSFFFCQLHSRLLGLQLCKCHHGNRSFVVAHQIFLYLDLAYNLSMSESTKPSEAGDSDSDGKKR